jgi:hypothetical protein
MNRKDNEKIEEIRVNQILLCSKSHATLANTNFLFTRQISKFRNRSINLIDCQDFLFLINF